MSKKSRPSPSAPPPAPPPARGAQVLLGLGLAESALSLFQWSQLITLRQGGATVCGVSEHVNCETVWNTPFAASVHDLLRMPVAALGLVWGLVAVALSTLFLVWRRGGQSVRPAVNGLRLTAAVGVASCAVFAAVSASTGVLCPTCLGTYVLTLAFAAVAWKGLPGALLPAAGEWGATLQWTAGFALAAYVALLLPGLNTPHAPSASSTSGASAAVAPLPGSLEDYLKGLSSSEQQNVADSLALYRQDVPTPALSPARRLYGPPGAPVKLVEWTDSRCPHCRALVEALAVMKKRVPAGKFSLEARQFPLDGECNFSMGPQQTDGSGTRCLAARGQICLEGAPDFWEVRERLFAAQRSLTNRDAVLDVLASGSVSRVQLDTCLASQDTERKLRDDIAFARQHDLKGTPLVVVNGREATAYPAFLYALILADGNPDASGFGLLPAPRDLRAQGEH